MNNREKTLYLIRHAQSHPSAQIENSLWPLSERGREQAASLSQLLLTLDIKRIYTSPYLRCKMTIEPFVKISGIPVHEVRDLHERDIAPGLIPDFGSVWDRSWNDFDFAVPGCESSRAAQRRFSTAIERIIADPNLPDVIACSTHGNVIGLFLNYIDSTSGKAETEALRNPDVVRINYENGAFSRDSSFAIDALASFATNHAETPLDFSEH